MDAQYQGYKAAYTYRGMILIASLEDKTKQLRLIIIIKRHVATQHHVGNDTNGPEVNGDSVRLTPKYFWSNILRRATSSMHVCSICSISDLGKSKISDLDGSVSSGVIVQEILWLQITMCNTL